MHLPSGINLAVKYIRIPQTKFNTSEADRKVEKLIREIKNFRLLSSHQNVVCFYGVCLHEDEILICMELMGLSLLDFYRLAHKSLNEENFPEELIGHVIVAVVDGLLFCKSKKIMHRDIKPSNILLNKK